MDHTSEAGPGQPNDRPDEAHARELQHLCELVQLIRAWWEQFGGSIRELDRAMAVRVHDVFIEAAITARAIARQHAITLPDFGDFDWTPSVPAPGRAPGLDM